MFSRPLVTSIQQRHFMPSLQPARTSSLQPRHKPLAVKRSLRCKQCEHTLSKADFNPSFTKFRINLSALYHVPDLRFALPPSAIAATANSGDRPLTPMPLPVVSFDSVPPSSGLKLQGFSVDKASNIVLVISNPAHRVTTVRLRQLTPEEETTRLAQYFVKIGADPKSTYSTVKVGFDFSRGFFKLTCSSCSWSSPQMKSKFQQKVMPASTMIWWRLSPPRSLRAMIPSAFLV